MKPLLVSSEDERFLELLRSRLGHVVLTVKQEDGNYLSVSMTRKERVELEKVRQLSGLSFEELLRSK